MAAHPHRAIDYGDASIETFVTGTWRENYDLVTDPILVGKRGRTDLPGGDADTLEASIARLLGELEGDFAIFPAHGAPWTLDEARHWWAEQGETKPK